MTRNWLKSLLSAVDTLLTGFILLALIDGPEGAADQLLTLTIVAAAIGVARAWPKSAYLPVLLALLILQWPLAAPGDPLALALAGRSEVLLQAGEKAVAAGQVEAGAALLDQAMRANPRSGKAKATSAALKLAEGQTPEAYELGKSALRDYQHPTFTVARTMRDGSRNMALYVAGKAAADLGYNDEAMTLLTQAAVVDPENGAIHWEMAGLFARDGLWTQAADAYQRVIAHAGTVDRGLVVQSYRLWGEALVRLGRLDEAATALKTSVDRNPGDAMARLDLGAVKMAQGRVSEAMADLRAARDGLRAEGNAAAAQAEQLLSLANDFIYQGYEAKGRERLNSRDYQGALRWFKKALALAPAKDVAELDLNLAEAHWQLQLYDQALAYYHEAVAIAPLSPRARHSLGWALGATGQFKEAEAQVKLAIALYVPGAPELPAAHSLLGLIYEVAGSREAARTEYLTALSLDPSDNRARTNLDRVVRPAQVSEAGGR
ncbi:MAG: tetratricopeptide repeat protein [Bacillota bacterium]